MIEISVTWNLCPTKNNGNKFQIILQCRQCFVCTVDFRWLEHGCLVYHDCFELDEAILMRTYNIHVPSC